MGIFSNIGSAVSGFISSVCSAVSDFCTSIGGEGILAIGTIAVALLVPGVGLPELLALVQCIAEIVTTIAKILGVNEGDDDVTELGMKAEISEKKPEDFDSIEEYIKYLNEEVELKKGDVENLSDEDKLKYSAMGTAINIKGIEEKYGMEMSGEFWRSVADLKMSGEEVKTYIDKFKENGVTTMQDMVDYLHNKETKADKSTVSDSIMESLSELYPDKSKADLEHKLAEMIIPE